MIGDVITVNARKYDGRIRRSWAGGLVSATDDLITLLARFSETHVHNDLGTLHAGTISLEYFWLDRWYNVFQFREPDGTPKAFYANIAMPATFDGAVIDYVDLDIDVILWPDGRVDVLDRDDFEQNAVTYGYTDDVKTAAERALTELLGIVERREFPFAS
jgi:protein associated with RNAse G/E